MMQKDQKDWAFVIHGQPITKKNSQQILMNRKTGRPFVAPSQAFKKYEKAAAAMLLQQARPREPICEAVNIRYAFYMETRRAVDLTNLEEAADDILVRVGILKDDNYKNVAAHDGSRVYYDKENPRTEIYITPERQKGAL